MGSNKVAGGTGITGESLTRITAGDTGAWHQTMPSPPVPWSVPQPLIHHVHQRLVFAVSFELLQEELHGALHPVGGMVGAMRGEQHVLQPVERVAVRQGLPIEYIQRRALDRSEEHTSEIQSPCN